VDETNLYKKKKKPNKQHSKYTSQGIPQITSDHILGH